MPGLLALLFKPQVLGALGVALLLPFASLQTWRISNLKHDLIDPTSKKTWQSEEMHDGPALALANRNLATCTANFQTEDNALSRQNAAVAALSAQSAADTAKATKGAQQALVASQTAFRLAAQVLAPSKDHSCAAAEAVIDGAVR